jgi:hypothetical protein
MHSLASFIERAQASGRVNTPKEAFAAYCDVLTRLPGVRSRFGARLGTRRLLSPFTVRQRRRRFMQVT